MAPPLAVPKGFKFKRFFSRSQADTPSSSANPPPPANVPPSGDGIEGSDTPIEIMRKKRQAYERSRQFQMSWLPIFTWAEPVVDGDEITKVICKVCSKITGKSKFLIAKSDNLWKHQGRKTALALGHGVPIGHKYLDYNSKHLKNERLFAAIPTDSVRAQVGENTLRDRRKKYVQFATIFHLLQQGRPLTDYEHMYKLFELLKLKNNPTTIGVIVVGG